jgi:hypothetical protein
VHCQIIGPAVFVPLEDCLFSECSWQGDLDSVLWEIPMERSQVVGAVALRACKFYDSTFQRIGMAFRGPAADYFRAELGGS